MGSRSSKTKSSDAPPRRASQKTKSCDAPCIVISNKALPVVGTALEWSLSNAPPGAACRLYRRASAENEWHLLNFPSTSKEWTPTEDMLGQCMKIQMVSDSQVLHERVVGEVLRRFTPYEVPTLMTGNTGIKTNSECEDKCYTVLSWNVLADSLTRESYPGLETRAYARWGWRGPALIKQIAQFRASVVCLQEIDKILFKTFWVPRMAELGYEGVRDDATVYGEAIFWRIEEFKLVQRTSLSYDGLVTDMSRELSNEQLQKAQADIMKLSTGRHGLIVHLCSVDSHPDCEPNTGPSQDVVVATTHLWTSRRRNSPLLRVLQLRMLLKAVHGISQASGAGCVVCGDFNAADDSPLYQFISDGRISVSDITDAAQWPQFVVANSLLPDNKDTIGQIFQPALRSAYREVLGRELKCVRKAADEKVEEARSVIEYILSNQICLGVMPAPRFITQQSIPNMKLASDHIPIMARFVLRGTATSQQER